MPFCYFAWSQYCIVSLFGSPFLSTGSIHPGPNWLLQLLTKLLLPGHIGKPCRQTIGCLLIANVPFSNGLADCAFKSSILLNSMWLEHAVVPKEQLFHDLLPSDYFCITSTSPMEGFSLSSILALPLFDQQLWLKALCNAYAHGSRISEAELSLMHHSLSTWLHTYNLNTHSPLSLLRLCSFLRQVLVNVGPWLAWQHVLVHHKTLSQNIVPINYNCWVIYLSAKMNSPYPHWTNIVVITWSTSSWIEQPHVGLTSGQWLAFKFPMLPYAKSWPKFEELPSWAEDSVIWIYQCRYRNYIK